MPGVGVMGLYKQQVADTFGHAAAMLVLAEIAHQSREPDCRGDCELVRYKEALLKSPDGQATVATAETIVTGLAAIDPDTFRSFSDDVAVYLVFPLSLRITGVVRPAEMVEQAQEFLKTSANAQSLTVTVNAVGVTTNNQGGQLSNIVEDSAGDVIVPAGATLDFELDPTTVKDSSDQPVAATAFENAVVSVDAAAGTATINPDGTGGKFTAVTDVTASTSAEITVKAIAVDSTGTAVDVVEGVLDIRELASGKVSVKTIGESDPNAQASQASQASATPQAGSAAGSTTDASSSSAGSVPAASTTDASTTDSSAAGTAQAIARDTAGLPLYVPTDPSGHIDSTAWTVSADTGTGAQALYTFSGDTAGGAPTGEGASWQVYSGPVNAG